VYTTFGWTDPNMLLLFIKEIHNANNYESMNQLEYYIPTQEERSLSYQDL